MHTNFHIQNIYLPKTIYILRSRQKFPPSTDNLFNSTTQNPTRHHHSIFTAKQRYSHTEILITEMVLCASSQLVRYQQQTLCCASSSNQHSDGLLVLVYQPLIRAIPRSKSCTSHLFFAPSQALPAIPNKFNRCKSNYPLEIIYVCCIPLYSHLLVMRINYWC